MIDNVIIHNCSYFCCLFIYFLYFNIDTEKPFSGMLDNYKCVYEKLAKKHLADCNDAYACYILTD